MREATCNRWHVDAVKPDCEAADAHEGNWIVEAAIPWDQMVDAPLVGRRQPWAVNIQRTIPGVGFQSWSSPASVAIQPEGMGLLLFDAAAKPRDAKPA